MTVEELTNILDSLLILPAETEVVEFKRAERNFDDRDLGQYFSALSNEANLKGRPCAWLVFGVENHTHEVVEHTKQSIISKDGVSYLIPFILITSCFALWGFANDITNPMVKAFSKIFRMSATDGALVQVAFYGGYFAMAFDEMIIIFSFICFPKEPFYSAVSKWILRLPSSSSSI